MISVKKLKVSTVYDTGGTWSAGNIYRTKISLKRNTDNKQTDYPILLNKVLSSRVLSIST